MEYGGYEDWLHSLFLLLQRRKKLERDFHIERDGGRKGGREVRDFVLSKLEAMPCSS